LKPRVLFNLSGANGTKTIRYEKPMCRVTMEAALEAEAALWTEHQCLAEVKLMERYTRRRMHAKIIRIDRLSGMVGEEILELIHETMGASMPRRQTVVLVKSA
jgi:hypothetical protein